eukprot:Gb_13454 [translate_table: standard]
MIREEGHWKLQIIEIGPNYIKVGTNITYLEGKEVEIPSMSGKDPGYRYFGVTKHLPSGKELFDKPPKTKKRSSKYKIYKCTNASYYGYRDDEDGILKKVEHTVE